MEKIPINYCSFSDLLRVSGIDNGLARLILKLRQQYNGLSLSLLHRFIRPIVPAYWHDICQCFDFSQYTCTSDLRPSSTKSSTYSDNYDRRHQSVDAMTISIRHRMLRNLILLGFHIIMRGRILLCEKSTQSLSSVSPGNSDFRHARDTFADQSSRRHEDDVTRRSASPQPIPFDGNGSWRAFYADFSSYVNERDWNDSHKDRYLYRCLGEARDYFKFVVKREPNIPFLDLVHVLEDHFAEAKFVRSEQMFDEFCSEGADRVLQLATYAYPDRSRRFIHR